MSISVYVISAIAGNFWQESGINPGIWEGLNVVSWTTQMHGFGLGQWTNVGTSQGRLYKLHEYLSTHNYSDDSGEGQVKFLIEEDYWTSQAEASSYSSLTDFLNSDSKDLTHLTHAYNIGWEGIHDGTWDDRVTYAKNCFDYIQEHYDDDQITEWIAGNRFLSIQERLNNAVMLYRMLSGDLPPDPDQPTGGKKRKMPVYMMLHDYYY